MRTPLPFKTRMISYWNSNSMSSLMIGPPLMTSLPSIHLIVCSFMLYKVFFLDHNLFSFNQYVNYCLFQKSVQQQSGYANAHMAAKLKAFLQSHGLTLPLNV